MINDSSHEKPNDKLDKNETVSNTVETIIHSTLYKTNNQLKKTLDNFETNNIIDETKTSGFLHFNQTSNFASINSYADNNKILKDILNKHKGIINISNI